MVEDELKANALPESFTQETVEQAVKQAGELNGEQRYNEAEDLLRKVLEQAPQHPEALKELNRALMHGRVYNQSRWDMLPTLVEYGRTILQNVDDEYVHHEIARTLLAIPAMPEAVKFIENWINLKGPNIERLGMLAWAKGCVADYDSAEALWNDVLDLAKNAERDQILFHVPFIAYTLVDCLAAVDDLPRAQHIAQQAWAFCKPSGTTSQEVADMLYHHRPYAADSDWLMTFHLAKLDIHQIARELIAALRQKTDPRAEATIICIRGWIDDPAAVTADWLDWVRERLASGQEGLMKRFQFAIIHGMTMRGEWRAAIQMAQGTWELLQQSDAPEAKRQVEYWDCQRLDTWGAIQAEDWTTAEEIFRQHTEQYGIDSAGWEAVTIATKRGTPVPPDVMRSIEQKSLDRYDLCDWYAIAREAGAAGDTTKAFSALRKALTYWTNPPYGVMNEWESDPYWGDLREHPEFKQAFEEKRRRIGPVFGMLHYFPGW